MVRSRLIFKVRIIIIILIIVARKKVIILNIKFNTMKILPEQIAIWVRSMYTVMYYPNVPLGVTYSGTMPNQPCTVGEVYTVPENQYLCTGYRFQGWNTKMDGTGKSYNTAESGQDGLSQENGATIKLYAQWSKCEHNAANLTYRINKNETGLIQTCSCGAHTAEVTLQTVDQVYDKKEHPVTLRYSGDTWSQAIPDIQYEWRKAGQVRAMRAATRWLTVPPPAEPAPRMAAVLA